jgi:hypothetical protein
MYVVFGWDNLWYTGDVIALISLQQNIFYIGVGTEWAGGGGA